MNILPAGQVGVNAQRSLRPIFWLPSPPIFGGEGLGMRGARIYLRNLRRYQGVLEG
ncbi:hypothetical protein Poly41_17950 [Novipirellula artificiosorum]|uniref:Uncharacterized protein n=1 Tax=Novipirellula artificiosorum TaxID=2528016 RepID=A0A5C6DW50_9BACT|nr:hypothetical protein Poly41_17950 [Novipirellula artificiosorum]